MITADNALDPGHSTQRIEPPENPGWFRVCSALVMVDGASRRTVSQWAAARAPYKRVWSDTTNSCVPCSSCTDDSQFVVERTTAASANSRSHAAGGMWLTKSDSSVPAPTPNQARIGTRDRATAISAADATSASATQTRAPRRNGGVCRIRVRNGVASVFIGR